jgi:S1-C subfamily serine protease
MHLSVPVTVGRLILVSSLLTSHALSAPLVERSPHPIDAVAEALRMAVMIEGDRSFGSGILINPAAGIVFTNQHVVDKMRVVRVTTYDGRTGMGTVVAVDEVRDLAVLSVPKLITPGLVPPRIGNAGDLRPGQEVYAVGMPRKLRFTVSRGIVSFVSRKMAGTGYLQIDMNINEGNSGGPVVSGYGELVGMMSFIYRRSQGLSFALPSAELVTAFPSHVPVIATRTERAR